MAERIERRSRGMRGRGWSRALLVLPFLLAPAPGALAAQENAREEVLIAAIAEMRGAMPRARMAVDPSLLCTARLVGWSCPERVQRALDSNRVSPRGREFTYVCLGGGPRRCQLLGTESLIDLAEPEIDGGRASVVVDLWWRSGRHEAPVGHRKVELEMEREGRRGEWRVVKTVPRAM